MNKIDRQLLRTAIAIHDHACRTGPLLGAIHLPEYAWAQIQRLKRQISLAQDRGWHSAASVLAADLADTCQNLQRQLETSFRDAAVPNLPRTSVRAFRRFTRICWPCVRSLARSKSTSRPMNWP